MLSVELIGPPGVGKSTLKYRLLRRQAHDRALIDQYALPIYEGLGVRSAVCLSRMAGARLGPIRALAKLARVQVRQRFINSRIASKGSPEWDDFLRLGMEGYFVDAIPAREIAHKLQLFFESYCYAAFARDHSSPDVVIFDEGLGQRGISLARSRPESKDAWSRYYETMPSPSLLCVLTAPPDLIHQRLVKRDGEKGGLFSGAEAALEATYICADIMASRGVETIFVDTSHEMTENIQSIVDRLNIGYTRQPVTLNRP